MSQYIGREIGGYRVIAPIGAGGMAKVFKAYQPSFDRLIALKILPEHYAEDETYVSRFKREAQIIASLEHRHILPVHDYGEDGGITYLAMRYLRGGSLKDLILKSPGGRLPLTDIVRVIDQIGGALDYAHEQGIVHRDIKPANILVDAQGDAFLMDFGIAKVLEGTQQLTATGAALGTPAYMAPEQTTAKYVDHRADIYALGVMLYQMLTGRVPFEADTPYAVLIAHVNDPLPLPSTINPDIPEALERVLFKALAKNPDDRYQSAGELASGLRNAVYEMGASADDLNADGDFIALSEQLARDMPSDEVTRDVIDFVKRSPRKERRGISPVIMAVTALLVIGIIVVFGVMLSRSNASAANAQATAQALAEEAETPEKETPTLQVQATDVPTQTAAPTEVEPTIVPAEVETDSETIYRLDQCNFFDLCIFDQDDNFTSLGLEGRYTSGHAIPQWSWSPDGTQIVFGGCIYDEPLPFDTDLPDCGPADIFIANVDGTDIHQLIQGGVDGFFPRWSPDGEWIAFHDPQLVIAKPDGSEVIEVVNDLGRMCINNPIWSPDSQQLAFVGWPGVCMLDSYNTVWIVNRDGSNLQVIYSGEELYPEWMAWSPDGVSIIVQTQSDMVYQIDANCADLPTGCDESSRIELESFPKEWTPWYFPLWAGEVDPGTPDSGSNP